MLYFSFYMLYFRHPEWQNTDGAFCSPLCWRWFSSSSPWSSAPWQLRGSVSLSSSDVASLSCVIACERNKPKDNKNRSRRSISGAHRQRFGCFRQRDHARGVDLHHMDHHLHLPGLSVCLRPVWPLQDVCNIFLIPL